MKNIPHLRVYPERFRAVKIVAAETGLNLTKLTDIALEIGLAHIKAQIEATTPAKELT